MQEINQKEDKQPVNNINENNNPAEETSDKVKNADENMEIKSEEPDLSEKMAEINDKYLRLVAEFDNFRKRVAREKLDILLTASEDVIRGLLPVIDDFERAQDAMQLAYATDSLKEGVKLIYEKLFMYLQNKGLQRIDAKGLELNTDLHEAIGKMPATDKNSCGKIIEIVENGYTLNGKVIRYAKVIIGE